MTCKPTLRQLLHNSSIILMMSGHNLSSKHRQGIERRHHLMAPRAMPPRTCLSKNKSLVTRLREVCCVQKGDKNKKLLHGWNMRCAYVNSGRCDRKDGRGGCGITWWDRADLSLTHIVSSPSTHDATLSACPLFYLLPSHSFETTQVSQYKSESERWQQEAEKAKMGWREAKKKIQENAAREDALNKKAQELQAAKEEAKAAHDSSVMLVLVL